MRKFKPFLTNHQKKGNLFINYSKDRYEFLTTLLGIKSHGKRKNSIRNVFGM